MFDWVKKLTPHKPQMRLAIWAMVVLLLVALGTKCNAAEVMFEGGSTIVRGETPAIGISLAFDGPIDTELETGFYLVGSSTYPEQSCVYLPSDPIDPVRECTAGVSNPNNIFLHATLVDGFGPFKVGLGLATMQNEDSFNSGGIQFTLLLRLEVTERVSVSVRHFSNSGTSKPNTGRDILLVGWKF